MRSMLKKNTRSLFNAVGAAGLGAAFDGAFGGVHECDGGIPLTDFAFARDLRERVAHGFEFFKQCAREPIFDLHS